MTTGLTTAQFNAVFQAFVDSPTSSSVFRWEALQRYSISADEPSLVAFRKGAPRPERSVRTSPWLARIAVSTVAGKEWSRVRHVVEPRSEYVTWELLAFVESQAAGERISITVESDVDEQPDFWLFDGAEDDRRAVVMHYASDGTPTEFELVDDDECRLTDLRRARDAFLMSSSPLNMYLAAHGGSWLDSP